MSKEIILLRSASRYWTIISPTTQKPRWFVLVVPTMGKQHYLLWKPQCCTNFGPVSVRQQWCVASNSNYYRGLTQRLIAIWELTAPYRYPIPIPRFITSVIRKRWKYISKPQLPPSSQTTYRNPYRRETTRICSRISIAIVDMGKQFRMRKRWKTKICFYCFFKRFT